jgi:hypothetical protein
MTAEIAKNLLQVFPLTLSSSAWYLSSGLFALVMLSAVAVYAFYTSRAAKGYLPGSCWRTDRD